MNNELVNQTLKLEGERFMLLKQIDRCSSIYDYPHLRNKLNHLNEKIEQYQLVIKAFNEMNARKKK